MNANEGVGKVPIVLLSDSPVDEDAFGGHKPLADTIARTIAGEAKGRGVAIIGAYGSGKSTVVRLVHNNLRDMDEQGLVEYHDVHFDAWGHQDERLQRAFLLTAIESLAPKIKNKKAKENWEAESEKLRTAHTETVERSSPRLNIRGKVVAGLVILASLLLAALELLPETRRSIALLEIGGLSLTPFGVGLGTLTLALIVGAGFVVWPAKPDSGESDKEQAKAWQWFPGLLEPGTETRVQISAPQDETSLQFDRKFKRLVSDFLDGKDEHRTRLVFVFDNLDRLPTEQRKSAWAALEIFITAIQEPSLAAVWGLVPYSIPDGESSTAPGRSPEVDPSKSSAEPPAHKDTLDESEQIRKLFGVEYYVPPITDSDWMVHVRRLASKAMPSLERSDLYAFAATLRQGFTDLGRGRPSPRDVVSTINACAAYHARWGREISPSIIALYVVNRRETEISSRRIREHWMDLAGWSSVGRDVRAQLAMLHYGVPRERAIQLLVQPALEEILRGSTGQDASSFATLEGFTDTLDEAVRAVATPGSDVGDIATIGAALKALEQDQLDIGTHTLSHLHMLLQGAAEWKRPDINQAAGLAFLLAKSADPNRVAKGLKSIHAQVWETADADDGESDDEYSDLEAAGAAWHGLWNACESDGISMAPIKLELSSEQVWVLSRCLPSDANISSLYRTQGAKATWWDAIHKGLVERHVPWNLVELDDVLPLGDTPAEALSEIRQILGDANSDSGLVGACYAVATRMEDPQRRQAVASSMPQQALHHLGRAASSGQGTAATAIATSIALFAPQLNGNARNQPPWTEVNRGRQDLDSLFGEDGIGDATFASTLLATNDWATLLTHVLDHEAIRPVGTALLANWPPDAAPGENLEKMAREGENLGSILDAETLTRVLKAFPEGELDSQLQAIGPADDVYWLLEQLEKKGVLSENMAFGESWADTISEESKGRFDEALDGTGHVLDIGRTLTGIGFAVEYPESFRDALGEAITRGTGIFGIAGLADKDRRAALRRARDMLIDDPDLLESTCDAVEHRRVAKMFEGKESFARLLEDVAPAVVSDGQLGQVVALSQVLGAFAPKRVRREDTTALEAELSEALETATEDLEEPLRRIAKQIGVSVETPEK